MRRNPEQHLQKALVKGMRACLPHGWIVQHCANQARSKVAGAINKEMGVIAGWPDIMVLGHADMFKPGQLPTYGIEVKAPKGRVSDEQHAVHDRLRDLGYPVAVVRSWEDVQAAAKAWGWPWREAA